MNAIKALQLIDMALTLGFDGVEVAQKIAQSALGADDPNRSRLRTAADLADEADVDLAQAIREAADDG